MGAIPTGGTRNLRGFGASVDGCVPHTGTMEFSRLPCVCDFYPYLCDMFNSCNEGITGVFGACVGSHMGVAHMRTKVFTADFSACVGGHMGVTHMRTKDISRPTCVCD